MYVKGCITLLIFLGCLYTPSNAQPNFTWVSRIWSPNNEFTRGVVADKFGNYYISGRLNTIMYLDSAGFIKTYNSFGGTDLFLAKYNCSKILQWVNIIGSPGDESGAYGLIMPGVDPSGNPYLTGTFRGTATITSRGSPNQTIVSDGNTDIILVKYDGSGKVLWTVKSGGTSEDEGAALAFDDLGNCYQAAFFSDQITIGTTSGATGSQTSAGNQDVFLAKYSPAGVLQWSSRAGSPALDVAVSVCVANADEIYVCGGFGCCSGGTANFGTHSITNASGTGASWGGFVAKSNGVGVWQWVNGVGSSSEDNLDGVEVDPSGNVYVMGSHIGTTEFTSSPPGNNITLGSNGLYDMIYASYTKSGVLRWAKNIGGAGSDILRDIETDRNYNIGLCGQFAKSVVFGSQTLVSSGSADAFIMMIDTSGNITSARKAGGFGDDIAFSLCFKDVDNGIYMVGSYTDDALFGATQLQNAGSNDGFITRLGPLQGLISLVSGSSPFCEGDSSILQVIPNNGSYYIWYKDNVKIDSTTSNFIYAKSKGNYKVTGFDVCKNKDSTNVVFMNTYQVNADAGMNQSVCYGDSIQLSAGIGSNYKWSPSGLVSNDTVANPYAKPLATTDFILTMRIGTCIGRDTINLKVLIIQPDAGSDQRICLGDSIQLNPSGGIKYSWVYDPGLSDTSIQKPFATPDDTTTYYVWVSDGICRAIDSVTVFMVNILSVDAGSDTSICFGDSAQFNAAGGSAFHWTPVAGINNPSISNPRVSPPVSTTYTVTAISGTCSATDDINIIVFPLPTVFAGNDTVICNGNSFRFETQSDATIFKWTPSLYLDDDAVKQPLVHPLVSIIYTLMVVSPNGCRNVDNIEIGFSAPTASFSAFPDMGNWPLSVQFTNKSTPTDLHYEWNFGDTAFSYEKDPLHLFAYPRSYFTILKVTDKYNCTDTASLPIRVNEVLRVFIPNVFTPNLDGQNEVFRVFYDPGLIMGLTGSIWNRWGQKIYEFNMPGGKWWDGTSLGQLSPSDVYVYMVTITDLYGKMVEYSGSVTLLR